MKVFQSLCWYCWLLLVKLAGVGIILVKKYIGICKTLCVLSKGVSSLQLWFSHVILVFCGMDATPRTELTQKISVHAWWLLKGFCKLHFFPNSNHWSCVESGIKRKHFQRLSIVCSWKGNLADHWQAMEAKALFQWTDYISMPVWWHLMETSLG